MPTTFSPVEDFNRSLLEIQVIIRQAEKNQKNKRDYDICIKSALLFLVAKFETFLEYLVTDYIHTLENKSLHPTDMPNVLKLHYADKLIDDKFISELRNHRTNALKKITILAKFCEGSEIIDSIDIDTGFDYGKHGPKAMNKLFSKIGIDDVFSTCNIYEMRETITGRTRVRVNIEGEINALTNHRNSILHSDATPSVTHQQIATYKKHLTQFSRSISKVLQLRLYAL